MADISKELNQIKNAVYGREVRGSIHDGIDKINKEVEDSTETSNQAKDQVENIQEQVNNLVVEGDSSVEAAQARVDVNNHSYPTLKDRLDQEYLKKPNVYLSATEPTDADENTYWYEDLGEAPIEFDPVTIMIANAELNNQEPNNVKSFWFKT